MAKKKAAEPVQGGREVLSTSGKIIRWVFSIVLILYSMITIFVLAVTIMDSLKTKGDLVTPTLWACPRRFHWPATQLCWWRETSCSTSETV